MHNIQHFLSYFFKVLTVRINPKINPNLVMYVFNVEQKVGICHCALLQGIMFEKFKLKKEAKQLLKRARANLTTFKFSTNVIVKIIDNQIIKFLFTTAYS